MRTKKEIILEFINQENYPKALSIAKTFVRDFDKEGQRIIQIAHECVNGSNTSMYKMLGIDVEKTIEEAKHLLNDFRDKKEIG